MSAVTVADLLTDAYDFIDVTLLPTVIRPAFHTLFKACVVLVMLLLTVLLAIGALLLIGAVICRTLMLVDDFQWWIRRKR